MIVVYWIERLAESHTRLSCLGSRFSEAARTFFTHVMPPPPKGTVWLQFIKYPCWLGEYFGHGWHLNCFTTAMTLHLQHLHHYVYTSLTTGTIKIKHSFHDHNITTSSPNYIRLCHHQHSNTTFTTTTTTIVTTRLPPNPLSQSICITLLHIPIGILWSF